MTQNGRKISIKLEDFSVCLVFMFWVHVRSKFPKYADAGMFDETECRENTQEEVNVH